MDIATLFYGAAVGWFTHTCFRIASLIYQFETFPRTFGTVASISLRDLAEGAAAQHRDLPAFKIIVPAYQESEVIQATVRRLASLNYPRTHFDIYVATYEDEPVSDDGETTYAAVRRIADEIGVEAQRPLVHPLHVPATYDGYFPGNLNAEQRHIGKGRGLNFALRSIHEENERAERRYYIGKMSRLGHIARIDDALRELAGDFDDMERANTAAARFLHPRSPDHIGALALSSQLHRLLELARRARWSGTGYQEMQHLLLEHIEHEAPRFFLELTGRYETSATTIGLKVRPDKAFLYDVIQEIENESPDEAEHHSRVRDRVLEWERPVLFRLLGEARHAEEVFQLVRRMNSRWVMVYDADADPPVDLMRFLAKRILTEPSVMGFQGPVSPIGNYDDVHPLCKLGGLWMGFWHATNYPRLMNREHWAHPLAGTNWCFRVDGIDHDGRLLRDCPYDEAKRRFLLSFDPSQLTEDLEAGIRIYSQWRVNAEWHPYLELEQVPPTPRALVVQRTRWTQGTLQTLHYILHTGLPWRQKVRFVFHPLEILISGSGPVVTLLMWFLLWTGKLIAYPVFAAWTVILTLGNLLYVESFLRSYTRFDGIIRRAGSVGYVRRHGPLLLAEATRLAHSGGLSTKDSQSLRRIAALLDKGLRPDGFVTRYLATRCLDDRNDTGVSAGGISVDRLLAATPSWVDRNDLARLNAGFQQIVAELPETTAGGHQEDFSSRLKELESMAALGRSRPLHKRIRERLRIWGWTFPYLFFQLTPYFIGLSRWLRGQHETHWDKTMRTRKVIHRAPVSGAPERVGGVSRGERR